MEYFLILFSDNGSEGDTSLCRVRTLRAFVRPNRTNFDHLPSVSTQVRPLPRRTASRLTLCSYFGFLAYEYAKRSFQARNPPGQSVPVWATLASGSCGGMAYWLACYPLGWSAPCFAPGLYLLKYLQM